MPISLLTLPDRIYALADQKDGEPWGRYIHMHEALSPTPSSNDDPARALAHACVRALWFDAPQC